ncbi:exopolysaccharide biosynthesis protein [Inquilinus sp. KBS0705]|nr:exopolysaccharide biosynthesis protein [Inquilinus sp. KBS0705]
MILVAFGTWTMPFYRLLKEVERLVKDGIITEQVIVQTGNTPCDFDLFEHKPFYDKIDFERLYEDASFVIVQAGEGSIMHGLKSNKKVISVARLARYEEHIDDHQLDILNTFVNKGYILGWNEGEKLEDIINKIPTFKPVPYPFVEENISDVILEYLKKL